MKHQVLGLRTLVLATALAALAGLGTPGIASGKKQQKPLKVSCERLYAEIDRTGAQLQAKYNATGFTIGLPDPAYPDYPALDGFNSGQACKKQGKRIRQGVGYMNDISGEAGPPFPGETNPAIREYFWTWSQTVTRTKKGRLRSAITSLKCEKYSYDGTPGNPQNTQTFPC